MSGTNTSLDVIANDISYIKRDIAAIKEQLKSDYVTREEFAPIKTLVYGLVGLILTSVVISLLALVILKN